MRDLKSLNFKQLAEECKLLGLPMFKVKEVFRAIHKQRKEEIAGFTTLSKIEREKLAGQFYLSKIIPYKIMEGKQVKKVAFELEDGKRIEAVLMEYHDERNTLCVSSQVGCPIKCNFCATGKMGFKRNLTTGEILSQVYYFSKDNQISNIVFMGMGEPFLNYDHVLSAARILNHPLGLEIAARKIVISTVGIVPAIKKFAREPEQFRLAWSLASPFDQIRKELISLKRIDSVSNIVDALRDYQKRTGRRVSLEYVVLDGINDRYKDADALKEIAELLDCHINLIPYNPISAADIKSGNIELLYSRLRNAHVNATIRRSFGVEINAACGQLASS
jgi:23S rRNA (adenine2503-C2)-methyltransferase